ncbi:TfoX/Sxy family DNA transformation protein [Vibrio harveyi]|uniref:TfoX/Sxy family DNA transformation protein n=1 Tax=Vibrio harveyi TaxID=669 RepID=UPI002480BD77|nr:TfoX/Sxy family DNA transformation protein [Vibrio harveyi]
MNDFSDITNFCQTKFKDLGCCTVRAMFGAYGVSINGLTIAHVHGGKLYIRLCDENSDELLSLGGDRYSYTKGGRFGKSLVQTNYYSYPSRLWESERLIKVVEHALKDARVRKEQTKNPERSIRDLFNLTFAHEKSLSQHGITSQDDLTRIGAIEAYRLLTQGKSDVNRKLLWCLEGAIQNKHWTLIPQQRKNELIAGV